MHWEHLFTSCFHHHSISLAANFSTCVTSYRRPSTSAPVTVSDVNIWASTNFNEPEKAKWKKSKNYICWQWYVWCQQMGFKRCFLSVSQTTDISKDRAPSVSPNFQRSQVPRLALQLGHPTKHCVLCCSYHEQLYWLQRHNFDQEDHNVVVLTLWSQDGRWWPLLSVCYGWQISTRRSLYFYLHLSLFTISVL